MTRERDSIVVTGPEATYSIDQKLGGTRAFTLYRCQSDARPGEQCILKIATSVEHNGLLDREAYLLRLMQEEAARLEIEYAEKTDGKGTLNYRLAFPEVLETFIATEHQERRALMLGFNAVNDLSELVPVTHVRTRDHVRVDPMTSAWILGKLLKVLVFAHSQGIVIKNLSGGNILIIRERHGVVIFDWSAAVLYEGAMPRDSGREEICKVAREAMLLLGGDLLTGKIPDDDQLMNDRYAGLLWSLVCGKYGKASDAHKEFYELVEELWGRVFHPYTTYPLLQRGV